MNKIKRFFVNLWSFLRKFPVFMTLAITIPVLGFVFRYMTLGLIYIKTTIMVEKSCQVALMNLNSPASKLYTQRWMLHRHIIIKAGLALKTITL